MFGTSIASRVNKVVKARIASAQAEFDEFCKDAKAELALSIESLKNKHETEKEAKADQLIAKILK